MAVMLPSSGSSGTVTIENGGKVVDNVSAKIIYKTNWLFDEKSFLDIDTPPELIDVDAGINQIYQAFVIGNNAYACYQPNNSSYMNGICKLENDGWHKIVIFPVSNPVYISVQSGVVVYNNELHYFIPNTVDKSIDHYKWSMGDSTITYVDRTIPNSSYFSSYVGYPIVFNNKIYIPGILSTTNQYNWNRIAIWSGVNNYQYLTLSGISHYDVRCVVHNNELFVFGNNSSGNSTQAMKDVTVNLINTSNSVSKKATITTPIAGHFFPYVTDVNGTSRIVLLCGYNNTDGFKAYHYLVSTNKWASVTQIDPPGLDLSTGLSSDIVESMCYINITGQPTKLFRYKSNRNELYYAEDANGTYSEYYHITFTSSYFATRVVKYNGKMLLFGKAAAKTHNTVYEYLPSSGKWIQWADFKIPETMIDGSDNFYCQILNRVVSYRNSIYLIGFGSDNKRCYRLKSDKTWEEVEAIPCTCTRSTNATSQYGHVVVYDDCIYAMGLDGTSSSPKNAMYKYDGTNWITLSGVLLPDSGYTYAAACTVYHNKIYLFGGVVPSNGTYRNAIWTYDGTGWNQIGTLDRCVGFASVAIINDEIYLYSTYILDSTKSSDATANTNKNMKTVFKYNQTSNTLEEVTSLTFTCEHVSFSDDVSDFFMLFKSNEGITCSPITDKSGFSGKIATVNSIELEFS